MPTLTRAPAPLLRPFVALLWAMDEPAPNGGVGSVRELMVPTGTAHIVFRLVDEPLRIYTSPDDPTGMAFRHGVLGAPHSSQIGRAHV